MSAATWSQGVQPVVQTRGTNPLPVCFNCGIKGHFVVDCPASQRPALTAYPQPAQGYQQHPTQQTSWPVQPAQPQNQFQSFAPVQQYPQQPPIPQFNYNQPQPPYHPTSSTPQYGHPPIPNPQYPAQPAPPQFGNQGYPTSQQHFRPPSTTPYQQPSNGYAQGPNSGSSFQFQQTMPSASSQYQNSQWNGSVAPHRQSFSQQQNGFAYRKGQSNPPTQQSQRHSSYPSLNQNQSIAGPKIVEQRRSITSTISSARNTVSEAAVIKVEPGISRLIDSAPLTDDSNLVVVPVSNNMETKVLNPPRKASLQAKELPKEQSENQSENQSDEKADEKPEEGEVGPEEEAEEAFQWDFKHAFVEVLPKETVALAQPLSASFKSTPVPLLLVWSTKIPWISRYARSDNLAEYVRTIRSSPQWSYLQEDPAFAEGSLEGELIPFDDVPAWMEARHQGMSMEESEADWENPKKRSRDESEEQESLLEARDGENDDVHLFDETEPQLKRQRQEETQALEDEIMEEARSVGTPGTMIVIENPRGGTPHLAMRSDDSWAPEPGERATSPPDPTEALLASLGVSGEAKPVKQNDFPPHVGGGEDNASHRASQTPATSQPSTTFQPANMQSNHGPPENQGYPMTNGTPSNQSGFVANGQPTNSVHTNGHQMSGPQVNSSQLNAYPVGGPMNGSHMSGPPVNNPQMNNGYPAPNMPQSQYAPAVNMGHPGGHPVQQSYHNGPPINGPYPSDQQYNGSYPVGPPMQAPYQQPSYGPPVNTPYQNGPPNNYPQGPPQVFPQYGQPQIQAYGNAPQPNGPQGYTQYGPSTSYANGPPQNAQYPPPQYGPPVNQQYANGPAPNYQSGPQYGPAQNQPFNNGQQMASTYGPNMQTSPTQYGPPQVQQQYPVHGYQEQPYANGPAQQYGNGPQGNFQNSAGPPAQMPVNYGLNSNAPVRQDSGYGSAREPYSNGYGPSGFDAQNGAQNQQGRDGFDQSQNGFHDQNGPQQGQNQFASGPSPNDVKSELPMNQVQQQPEQTPENKMNGTSGPLIETTKEVKKKRTKNGSQDSTLSDLEKELLGELDPAPTRRNPARKVATKKPQPVVEAAYSRRW